MRSVEVADRGAQVVVSNQGKTLSIIDYLSDADTTKEITRVLNTGQLYRHLGGNSPTHTAE
jgi:hypothetical protein